MANITTEVNIHVKNGNFELEKKSGRIQIDQAGTGGGTPGAVLIGSASEETIAFGDVSPGYVWMRNLDGTNFVSWGFTTGELHGKLSPGASIMLELKSTASLIMQADTADCWVDIASAAP